MLGISLRGSPCPVACGEIKANVGKKDIGWTAASRLEVAEARHIPFWVLTQLSQSKYGPHLGQGTSARKALAPKPTRRCSNSPTAMGRAPPEGLGRATRPALANIGAMLSGPCLVIPS